MEEHRIKKLVEVSVAIIFMILSLIFVVYMFSGIFHYSDRDSEMEKNNQFLQQSIATNMSDRINASTSEKNNHLYFPDSIYNLDIFNNQLFNSPILKLQAIHSNKSKSIEYNISSGNTDNNFEIGRDTGIIKIHQKIRSKQYPAYIRLIVSAFDGELIAIVPVLITIKLYNENNPYFENSDIKLTIMEEKMIEGCITIIKAYDPDIKDKNADQHITYSMKSEDYEPYISIDKSTGCLKMKKPFDREHWQDHLVWDLLVIAQDNDNGIDPPENSLSISMFIMIDFIDVNDNPPFLTEQNVIWYQNEPPGKIIKLEAIDYDSEKNGAPFQFKIDVTTANMDITKKFSIVDDFLIATVTFDILEQNSYAIPILITDSGTPKMSGTSILTVNIFRVNDFYPFQLE